MSVYPTIITVFAELFLCVASLASFGLLARSYMERRTATLLAYAGGFVAMTFAVVTYFIGHAVAATGSESTSINVFRCAYAFMAVSGLQFCSAASWHLSMAKRRLLMTAAVAITAYAVYVAASADMTMVQAFGVCFVRMSPVAALSVFAPIALYSLISLWRTVMFTRVDAASGKHGPGSRRLFFAAGIAGGLFVVIRIVGAHYHLTSSMPAAYLMLLAMLLLTAVAAAAVDHPDEQIRVKPLTMFRRSMLLKLGGINALVVWLLAAVAMSLFFPSHAATEAQENAGAMSRDVRYFVQAHDARVYALISDADTVARDPQTLRLIANGGNIAPEEYAPQIVYGQNEKSGFGVVRVVNAEGVILFSTYRKEEVGTSHAVSPALNTALEGRSGSGWERSRTFGTWVMRAASPVIIDGKVAGAVVMAEIDRAFVADGDALSQAASGYGMVSPDGDLAFSSGKVLNAEERSRLRAAIVSAGVLTTRIDDKSVFAAPSDISGGVPGGVYYAFLSDKDRDSRILLDIVSLASFIYFGIALMAAMLFAAMAGALRPLREMRDAALKLGSDRSIDEIRYSSPDEIGQLATAFNATASIVNQRAGALSAAMRERQDFLDHAARELRTPLTVFRWTLEAMRFGEAGSFTKEQLDMLEKLHQTNLRLERMVENLQDLNQVDRNRVKLTMRPVHVEDLIDAAAGEMSVQSRIKGIDLRWDRPEKPLPTVHADAAYVQKVLHNIVENAVKYTQPHGAITLHAETVDMSASDGRPGAFVQVTVKDSGIGIPTDESPRLFNRFFRAQNVAEFEIEGAGLGLYLAKRFVELHGGDIRVASKVGVGTTVTFTLPIHTP